MASSTLSRLTASGLTKFVMPNLAATSALAGFRSTPMIGRGMVYNPAYGETTITVPLFDSFMRRVIG